jgi:CheY-like chemotaxis protein
LEDLIDESIAVSRDLTAELSPPILHEAGLNAGLQWLVRRMADKYGLFVDLEIEEDGQLPEQLKILLFDSVRELLFNTVKHAQTSSAVVNSRHADGRLQITVSDPGVGFDPATMLAAGVGGVGFGLFGIRERLELMGGALQIKSTPGQGSLFVLSVPTAPLAKIEPLSQEILVLPKVDLLSRSSDPEQKIRVMLVDDHTVVRQGMANLLGDEPDIEVVGEAADGHEAIGMVAKLLPGVILMDMSMPKLNGIEATRIIHNDWPEIRIIGLSMFEEADRAQAMRDAGAVDYITKSGPASDLINVIRASVRGLNNVPSVKSPR